MIRFATILAWIIAVLLISCSDGTFSRDSSVPVVLLSLERGIVEPEFSLLSLDTSLSQTAILSFEKGEVTRALGFVDTSFTLHEDDLSEISALLTDAGIPSEEFCAKKPETDRNYAILRYTEGTVSGECYLKDSSLIAQIDDYLRLPVHTLLWPFAPQEEGHPVGHTPISFQNYLSGNENAYFHQGVDIVMPKNSTVFNILPGRVVAVSRYDPDGTGTDSPYYFQVVVETRNGLTIQYHHIDENTVPEAIFSALISGNVIDTGVEIGKIVTWPQEETGYSHEIFHHLHLNLLTKAGLPLNGMELLLPSQDSIAPVVSNVYLLSADRSTILDTGNISEDFHVVAETYDLIGDAVWPLPPRRYEMALTDVQTTVREERKGFDFLSLPYSTYTKGVCDYYLCGEASLSSVGNYNERRFYVVVTAFQETGGVGTPISVAALTDGEYTLKTSVCDEEGNCTEKETPLTIKR